MDEEILNRADNIWRYMLSTMCQRIIVETVIPEVVDRVADKQYIL